MATTVYRFPTKFPAHVQKVDQVLNTIIYATPETFERKCKETYPSYHLRDRGTHGRTALSLAAAVGNISLIQYFFSKLKDLIEVQDRAGHTPLFYAVRSNQLEAAAELIRLGANVNARSTSSWNDMPMGLMGRFSVHYGANETPLSIAARETSRIAMVKLLLRNGAKDPEIYNWGGMENLKKNIAQAKKEIAEERIAKIKIMNKLLPETDLAEKIVDLASEDQLVF